MAASQTRTHRLIVLSYVFYLASHADALSFNYSSPDQPAALVSRYDAALAFNATTGISSVLVAGSLSCNLPWADADTHIPFQISEVYSSASLEKKYYVTIGHLPDLFALRQLENRSCTGLPFLFANALQRCACAPFQVTQAREAWLGLSCSAGSLGGPELRSLPGYTSTRGIGTVPRGQTYTAFWFCSHMLRDETTPQRLLSSTDDPNTTTRRRQIASSSWMEQASVAGSAFGLICAVAGVAGLVLCCIRSKRPRQRIAAIELEDGEHIIGEPQLRQGLGPREFCYSDLAAATEDFAEGRKIGRGGFGPVYPGCLIDQDLQVAIKTLSRDEQSVQGLKEFQAEVTVMSQLRHRNIVRLVGWCGRRGGLALVYELMSGGSLDAHLYNPDRHLTWPQRYKIALQLGSALRYLHTDCDQCVVHGDIKPANIMLDACGNAKLGDFGLARLVDHGAEPQTTQVVAGTVGYIDPEFVSSRRRSAESDVYSYGVVLLEIACGRRPTPSRRARASGGQAASAALLLACVRDMYRRNVILEAADRRLDGEFDEVEMERLLVTGLWCAQQDPVQRPSIAQAMDVLRLRSEGVKLPVLLGTMVGPGEIRALEGQAYGDLPAESSAYLDDESTETAYLTTEETTYLFPKE